MGIHNDTILTNIVISESALCECGVVLSGKGCYNVRSVVAVYVFTLSQSYLRQIVVLNFISFNEREKFMNSEQLKNSNKVKLSKEKQLRMWKLYIQVKSGQTQRNYWANK